MNIFSIMQNVYEQDKSVDKSVVIGLKMHPLVALLSSKNMGFLTENCWVCRLFSASKVEFWSAIIAVETPKLVLSLIALHSTIKGDSLLVSFIWLLKYLANGSLLRCVVAKNELDAVLVRDM